MLPFTILLHCLLIYWLCNNFQTIFWFTHTIFLVNTMMHTTSYIQFIKNVHRKNNPSKWSSYSSWKTAFILEIIKIWKRRKTFVYQMFPHFRDTEVIVHRQFFSKKALAKRPEMHQSVCFGEWRKLTMDSSTQFLCKALTHFLIIQLSDVFRLSQHYKKRVSNE